MPALVMLPPPLSTTDHATAVLEAPLTLAVKVALPPAWTVAALGVIFTVTAEAPQASPTLMPWKAFHTACSSALPAP